jgi:hypothetical protein
VSRPRIAAQAPFGEHRTGDDRFLRGIEISSVRNGCKRFFDEKNQLINCHARENAWSMGRSASAGKMEKTAKCWWGKTGAYSMILKAKKPLSMSPIEFTRGDIHEKKRREIFALLTRSHKLARFEFVQNVR